MSTANVDISRDLYEKSIDLDYETFDITAQAGRDYDKKSGTVHMASGQNQVTLSIPVKTKPVNSLEREFGIRFKTGAENTILNKDVITAKLRAKKDLSPLVWDKKIGRMFEPKYWTTDSQPTESCSVISDGNILTATMTARTKAGLAGVIWDTEDKYDHKGIGYETHRNMSSAVMRFRITFSDLMPNFSIPEKSPTLTIILEDGTIHYVSLYIHADSISSDNKTATILLDFSNLKSGPQGNIPVDTRQVSQLMFSVVGEDYDEHESGVVPLPQAQELKLQIEFLEPKSGWTPLVINDLSVSPHDVRMCTSYDDMYNQTPERVVDNCFRLGYRDTINHYNGMSHYYEFSWGQQTGRWELNRSKFLNSSTSAWIDNYLRMCKKYNYGVINSVSFELMSTVCPTEWVQHTWDDALAATGYEPPSYVLSPLIEDGMKYIHNVMDKIATMCNSSGVLPQIQIGEPWWWYNVKSDLPCIYDYPTKVAFNNATGLYAQDIGTRANFKTGTPFDEYVKFIKDALGKRVVKFGEDLKSKFPNLKITLLPFLPSIIDNGLMQHINLPVDQYKSPNFDFYCTECYDWLIQGKMNKSFEAITIPNGTLGYPYSNIHYLAGFVPDEVLAPLYGFDPDSNYRPYLWKMIMGNIALNATKFQGIHQYIWAYPQIMHDSITVKGSSLNVFHMGQAALEGYLTDTPFNRREVNNG